MLAPCVQLALALHGGRSPRTGDLCIPSGFGQEIVFSCLSEEEVALVIHSNNSLITHLDVMKM